MSDDQRSEQEKKWRPLTEDARFFLTRVHALSDSKRRMLVGLDMAGIVALGGLVSWFWTEQGVSPWWARFPFLGFIVSLVFTYRAMDLDEAKTENYLKATKDGKLPVEPGRFLRAVNLDTVAWYAFLPALLLAAWQLVEVTG